MISTFILLAALAGPIDLIYDIPTDKAAHFGAGVVISQAGTHGYCKLLKILAEKEKGKKEYKCGFDKYVVGFTIGFAASLAKEQLDNVYKNNSGSNTDWAAGIAGSVVGPLLLLEW